MGDCVLQGFGLYAAVAVSAAAAARYGAASLRNVACMSTMSCDTLHFVQALAAADNLQQGPAVPLSK